jgi:hypothetical protein
MEGGHTRDMRECGVEQRVSARGIWETKMRDIQLREDIELL